MRALQKSLSVITIAMLSIGLVGCSVLNKSADDRADVGTISWLTQSLMSEGVFVQERGSANFDLPAEDTSRMVLDGQDVMDAYEFENALQARSEARKFASAYPSVDVYVKEQLVVVRYTDRAPGLGSTFLEIMGATV